MPLRGMVTARVATQSTSGSLIPRAAEGRVDPRVRFRPSIGPVQGDCLAAAAIRVNTLLPHVVRHLSSAGTGAEVRRASHSGPDGPGELSMQMTRMAVAM